jgi:hypothetical protein
VQHLIAFCLNDACRHQALIDVSSYPGENEMAARDHQRFIAVDANTLILFPLLGAQPT